MVTSVASPVDPVPGRLIGRPVALFMCVDLHASSLTSPLSYSGLTVTFHFTPKDIFDFNGRRGMLGHNLKCLHFMGYLRSKLPHYILLVGIPSKL